eukprot:Skav204549  [mRNA]  locus=scaffold3346:112983:117606:- [translate_table: standard]
MRSSWAIIAANAVVIGLETDEKEEDWLLPMLEDVFLCLFACELFLRLCAFGLRDFFNPWSSVRGLSDRPWALLAGKTGDRLLRILRIFRIFRVMRQRDASMGRVVTWCDVQVRRVSDSMGSIDVE